MRLLCFLARRFGWKSFQRTLESVEEVSVEDRMEDCVVAFVHAEAADAADGARDRVFRHVLKHLKWLAGKRGFRNVVLHSFTHLGAESAPPAFAGAFLEDVAARLQEMGYAVKLTPFGHFCEWELSVHGESLAKVWKRIE